MNPQILHWSYRDLHEFPEELQHQSDQIEEIYLKENFISTIPLWLLQFKHLKFIHLSGNTINLIPNEINLLENLEYLNLSKNHIKSIPNTIVKLKKLQYLNVSDNEIDALEKEIGSLTSLETFDASNNHLIQIPVELSNSKTLIELFFNDNFLVEIPTKVMSMKSLKIFEAERCCLTHLPGIIGENISHIRIFNNTRLTHYPIIYEKFLRLHYDYWSENVVSADLLMIFLPDEHKRTIIPRVIRKISFLSDPRMPVTLYELCLRTFYDYQLDNNSFAITNNVMGNHCPREIEQNLENGPISLCGYEKCKKFIFIECYFLLLKKNSSPSHIIFSNMFCSKDCTSNWLKLFRNKYHPIEWSVI